jgi:DNA-nicking Smr family endonuclease
MARKPVSHDKTRQDSRRLAPEDAALWDRVARSAKPLIRGKNRQSALEPDLPGTAQPPPPPAPKPKRAAPRSLVRATQPEPPKAAPPAQYDRREAKRLATGRAEIDARIDLHGMRQREAHRALNAFLASAQARGHRHVLVITGKGRSRKTGAPASFIDETVEPGVLRRVLPQWLDSLSGIVVGYTQAGPRHGGEGAFYVRLRKTGR